MPWIKIDDQFADHPKIVQAGPLAAWLHVCGLCYCGRYLTDGFIPRGQLRKLADVEDVTPLVTRLVTVGLWEEVEEGYLIHDYLDYNPSAEQVKAEREANAERQAAWRKRHRKGNGRFERDKAHSNGDSNGVTNGAVTTAPSPSPSPCSKEEGGEVEKPDPPACFPELFTTSIKDIKTRRFTRSQWRAILQAEREADGRTTLIEWIENKLNGSGHPAIEAYREEMGHYPKRNTFQDIIEHVGDNGHLHVWRDTVKSWRLRGYNEYNIEGMLDAFKAGGVKSNKPHRQTSEPAPDDLPSFVGMNN